ncbi:methyltransferase domain-containing protein [Aliidiomarina sp. Khilg15.8]
MSDRSFSGDVARFQKNIYSTAKGAIREAVLQADLTPLLQSSRTLRVLDVGAGIGQVNQLFATQGHQVVHTDIASDMVDAAKELHNEAGLSDFYQYHSCSIQELTQQLPQNSRYDVILCHAVLEWLDDPQRALSTLDSLLAPGGTLSLMFYNRDAKTMANLIYGNFDYVNAGLKVKKKVRFSPQQPLTIEQVRNWSTQLGWELTTHSGVRCIHDYLRDISHQSRTDLIDMELAYRRRDPFRLLGRYQHFLLQKYNAGGACK